MYMIARPSDTYGIDLPFIRLHSYVWGNGREFGDGNPESMTVALFRLQFGAVWAA